MTAIGWIILLIGVAAAAAIAWFTYFRREPAGRGRALLAVLRAAAITIIILLLIDPQLGARARGGRSGTAVVLDASLSMQPRAADSSIWRDAVRRARRAAGNSPVIVAGATARSVPSDSLDALRPQEGRSRLLPALQSAAEAGARRVVVITDGGIEDVPDVARWLPRLGVELDVERMSVPATANRAIAEVQAPAWAEAGRPIEMRVGISARGAAGNRARVVVRQGRSVVASTDVELPPDGRLGTANLSFPAQGPPRGGLVRFEVAFEAADAIPDDDVRSIYIFISEDPAGVAIISFQPDWEPRFLHPVLEEALGVPVRTFLRVPSGTYFRAGDGLRAGARVEESAVRAAAQQAEVLVLHGVTENAPAWWRTAAAQARRLVIFPAGPLGDPFNVSAPTSAEWYVSPAIPASPIAAFLENVDVSEVPPLDEVFATRMQGWAPLHAGRTRRGGNVPVIVAQESGGRRIAIALASGYWRWAFRGGASRDLYQRLWGATAGWLAQEQPQIAAAPIRPVQRVADRGEPLRWVAPGLRADSVQIRLLRDNEVLQEQTVRTIESDTLLTAPVTPGHYRYVARAFAGGELLAEADGPVSVDAYSAEFMRSPVDLGILRAAPAPLGTPARSGGTPLHALPWPYILLVLLLCAEWILRRRWGLR